MEETKINTNELGCTNLTCVKEKETKVLSCPRMLSNKQEKGAETSPRMKSSTQRLKTGMKAGTLHPNKNNIIQLKYDLLVKSNSTTPLNKLNFVNMMKLFILNFPNKQTVAELKQDKCLHYLTF